MMKASDIFAKKNEMNASNLLLGKSNSPYNVHEKVSSGMSERIASNAGEGVDYPNESNTFGRHVWLPNKKNRNRGGF